MNILVCLKQILDPEMPSRDFRIGAAGRDADLGAAGLVMNIFCANALETALQFREQHGGKITVSSRVGVGSVFRVPLPIGHDVVAISENHEQEAMAVASSS